MKKCKTLADKLYGVTPALECAFCRDKITGLPIKEGEKVFCSLECANRASGIVPEEADDYFEEGDLEGFQEDVE